MKSLMASAYSARGELLPVGNLHAVAEDFQPVAVRVQEVEGAAAAALQVSAGLDAVSEGAADDLGAVGVNVGQSLHELIPVLHLKGHLLHQTGPPGNVLGNVHVVGGGGDDEVMVGFIEPQEGRLRSVGPTAPGRDLAAQDLCVKLERSLEIGYQDPHVSNAFDLNTHARFLL